MKVMTQETTPCPDCGAETVRAWDEKRGRWILLEKSFRHMGKFIIQTGQTPEGKGPVATWWGGAASWNRHECEGKSDA